MASTSTDGSPAGRGRVEDAEALERFRSLLRIPTVSGRDDAGRDADFERFLATLTELYPRVHHALEVERVGGYSLVLRWRGLDAASPTVLMAHYDVVPAVPEDWSVAPFGAVVTGAPTEAVLHGRGTLDDKGALAAILEAVEEAVADGHVPRHDLYLCFGHTEEVSGQGASAMVAWFRDRGLRPALVLDEGGAVVADVFPTVRAPAAVVGVSERGVVSLHLRVTEQGGHASIPARLPATTRLARAIVRVHRHPFPVGIPAPTREFLARMSALASPPLRLVFSHLGSTAPLVARALPFLGPEMNALVRTTVVATALSGAPADNVMAREARATLNVRIQVGTSVADVVRHVRRAVRDDAVEIELSEPFEPSPVSPWAGEAWDRLHDALARSHPGVVLTPYIQLGASDSRFFAPISDAVYRFTPFEMTRAERASIHGPNERIRVDAWLRGIRFYRALIAGS